MSDFAQHGLIATLQRLNDSHLSIIEHELAELAMESPIAVILPCHGRDLTQPALAHILAELSKATWVGEVVVSLNGFTSELADYGRRVFASVGQHVHVLWNDDDSDASRATGKSLGKGANFRRAVEFLAGYPEVRIVATQDCDVASFCRADLARLCYAVARPELGYRFAKAYYSRVTDRLYGRVSRLFLQPLLHALLQIGGHQPMVDFLLSFRYPLAGEVAMTRELAESLPATEGWSLEIGHLCHVFRSVDPREICQVDGGAYDHKHQPAAGALTEMAAEIACELFRQLEMEGLPSDAAFRSAVATAYRREADHALHRSASLARINALPFDSDAEESIVAGFAARLEEMPIRRIVEKFNLSSRTDFLRARSEG